MVKIISMFCYCCLVLVFVAGIIAMLVQPFIDVLSTLTNIYSLTIITINLIDNVTKDILIKIRFLARENSGKGEFCITNKA
uniref:Putative product n=1 Tax=Xenopsylla cheopis TaxID=163159 RepID=A0A6M2E2U8_XENCH